MPAKSLRAALLSLVLVAGLALACVSSSSVMQSWVGKSSSELITAWGAPDKTAALDGGASAMTWVTVSGNQYGVATCRRTFVADVQGVVRRWSYSGCPRLQRRW
jgi:hypothetical protein